MASNHLRRKRMTYQSLSCINQHFAAICRHVWQLEQAGFMPILQMKVFRGLARELQSQISHAVIDKMNGVEENDMFRFGKTRINWEHYLNPDRPGFQQHR